jgi:predicted DNA-binding WGR domain protein
MTRLELVDGKSSKFWQADVVGKTLALAWGRIGTAGQSKKRAFATSAQAKAEHAKLVAEKRKKGYRDALERKVVKPGKVANVEPLLALAGLLTRKDRAGLEKELRLAVEQPALYFKRFEERLSNRGIDAPDETYQTTLAWIALVDGLEARKQLVEIDWREAPEDALSWLSETRTGLLDKKAFGFAKEVETLRTEVFVREAAKRFARAGVRMVVVDMKSDSYPLAFHSAKDDAKVKKLAAACKKAGFGSLRSP